MNNHPFRFLDSPNNVKQLRSVLDQIGLESGAVSPNADTDANPSNPARWVLKCRWLTAPVELHWHFRWWPDGEVSELSRVSVSHGGEVVGEVDVGELLGKKMPRALKHIIIGRLLIICNQLTRRKKSVHPK